MTNTGFRVIKNIQRPSKELILGFQNLQVANIDDCMNRSAAVTSSIKPINEKKLLGSAYTVKSPSGDNLLFYLALELAEPGDIIVISGGGYMERAVCGEIMARYAHKKQLGGFLIDGCIRDLEVLSKMDFPIFAKGSSPNGPYKNGPGEINVPVNIGGQVICPGDIIIGDSDGVIVVKPEEAKELQQMAKEIEMKEAKMLSDIESGKGLDMTWLYKKLEDTHCEFI